MSPQHDATPDEEGVPPELPGTRHRFGAALSGRPGATPNPAVALRQGDPIAAGIKAWRRLRPRRARSADAGGSASGVAHATQDLVDGAGNNAVPSVQPRSGA